MFTHAQIWQAIDELAQRHGYSPSGLARKAGLDPTTFNKSKRVSSDGKPRWPSTESVSKLLDVTGETMAEFLGAGARKLVPGDPVALQTKDDEMLTGKLVKEDKDTIHIELSDSSGDSRKISRKDITWLAHVVFVS